MVILRNKLDNPIYFGASVFILQRASDLRKNMTEAEKYLWEKIRSKQLGNFIFRRQHPIHCFIADFYCHKAKLVIEIDGSVHLHESQNERDNERNKIMHDFGLTVLRFTNNQVMRNINQVLAVISEHLEKYK